MSELNVWLSTHHPALLADYDRQRREGSTQLGLVGWLLVYHNEVWHAWLGTRVEMVRKAEKVEA